MTFQRIKELDALLEQDFINFCLKSKPYDFCCMHSRNMSVHKIKEYMLFLFKECEMYTLKRNDKIQFFVAVSKKDDEAFVEFAFGQPFSVISDFKSFRRFYSEINQKAMKFSGKITRKHKLKSYLKFLKQKDSEIQIILDNQEIAVLWNT